MGQPGRFTEICSLDKNTKVPTVWIPRDSQEYQYVEEVPHWASLA